MKWYEQKYVNHRDWILDNIELLNLTHTDLITVLVIDFLNEHHMTITSDVLCAKTRHIIRKRRWWSFFAV